MLIHDWQLRRFEWYDPVSMGGMINDVIFRFPSLRHGELEQKNLWTASMGQKLNSHLIKSYALHSHIEIKLYIW